MTDPASDKDKSKAAQEVAECTLAADVGELAEHNSVDNQNKSKTEHQSFNDLLAKSKESIKRIPEFPVKYWKSLERPEVSNRTIALATVVIAIATGLTYLEVHSGSAQTDKIIAADKRIADAIEGSLTQAKNAFTAANGQAILSQRAWIAIKINATVMPTPSGVLTPNPFILGQPFDIRVSFKNTGRTPALNVKAVAKKDRFFQKEGKFQIPDFSYEPENYVFSGNLTPDVEVYGDIDFPPLTDDAIKQVTSNQVRVFVHGRTEYDDVFGVHHWQNYCGFLLPTGAMSICPYHNEMDQNQPN